MSPDIVERLRKTPYQWEVGDLCDEAADVIVSLRKKVVELEKDIEMAMYDAREGYPE